MAEMFQSTPVIANGLIASPDYLLDLLAGFNPRPLLLTGESAEHPQDSGGRRVSIHARYC